MTDIAENLKQTLAALVAIDSTSSRPNLPVISYLEGRLKAAGYHCSRVPYKDDEGVQKFNLLAYQGEVPKSFALALVGHTDCVPFDCSWREALALTEKNGELYGRGACDTKGFIACALVAAERRPTPGLLLAFTADEEVGCQGAKEIVALNPFRVQQAIVGEPTQLIPVRAHKGYCLAEIEVRGKAGHSAYPDLGESAILAAARFIQRLEEWSQGGLRVQKDEAYHPPYTTLNVGLISGGKAPNVIPDVCRFLVEWRPLPKQPVEAVEAKLVEMAEEIQKANPNLQVRVARRRADRGMETQADAALVAFLEEASGKASTSVSFGTEAPELSEMGANAVIFGPGSIEHAHQTGERVPIADLIRCEEILEAAISKFARG